MTELTQKWMPVIKKCKEVDPSDWDGFAEELDKAHRTDTTMDFALNVLPTIREKWDRNKDRTVYNYTPSPVI